MIQAYDTFTVGFQKGSITEVLKKFLVRLRCYRQVILNW